MAVFIIRDAQWVSPSTSNFPANANFLFISPGSSRTPFSVIFDIPAFILGMVWSNFYYQLFRCIAAATPNHLEQKLLEETYLAKV